MQKLYYIKKIYYLKLDDSITPRYICASPFHYQNAISIVMRCEETVSDNRDLSHGLQGGMTFINILYK